MRIYMYIYIFSVQVVPEIVDKVPTDWSNLNTLPLILIVHDD